MMATPPVDQHCPCGSNKPFLFCCKPYIDGVKRAPTAEALMRSRYTAYVLGAVDYLIETTAPEKRDRADRDLITEQVQCTQWLGLEIIDTHLGLAGDTDGQVEFKASYQAGDEVGVLYERSNFCFKNDQWFYVDGNVQILDA